MDIKKFQKIEKTDQRPAMSSDRESQQQYTTWGAESSNWGGSSNDSTGYGHITTGHSNAWDWSSTDCSGHSQTTTEEPSIQWNSSNSTGYSFATTNTIQPGSQLSCSGRSVHYQGGWPGIGWTNKGYRKPVDWDGLVEEVFIEELDKMVDLMGGWKRFVVVSLNYKLQTS